MSLRRSALCASSLLLLLACRPRVNPDQPAAPAPAAAAQPAAPQAPAGPPPKLTLVESSFNGGRVKQGEPLRHTFVVKNNGLGELNIEKVQGS